MTRRSALAKENCGGLDGSVSRLRASHTSWNSCAHPIATTRDLPARAARRSSGSITAAFRMPFLNLTIGMSLLSANRATAWRNFNVRNQAPCGAGALQLKNKKLYSSPAPASRALSVGVCSSRANSSGRKRLAAEISCDISRSSIAF